MKKLTLLFCCLLGLGLVTACSSAPEPEDNKSAEQLYNTCLLYTSDAADEL